MHLYICIYSYTYIYMYTMYTYICTYSILKHILLFLVLFFHHHIGLGNIDFIPSMDHQKEFHYTGSDGKLLPLYKEPTKSSERLGSLFPGDDVLAYGIAANSDKSKGRGVDGPGAYAFMCLSSYF